jgi:LysR family hca operon transcriptional activator
MNESTLLSILPYLRYFQAIARHRNLRRAAEALHLSPSAVTQALKQLEDCLGLTLCVRSRKEFQLTPEGERLLEATELAFHEISRFADSVSQRKKTGGHLCLGIIDGFSNPYYRRVLNKLVTQFPDAYLSIMVFPSEEIIRRLLSGDLDGGFGIFSERDSNLVYEKIGEERLGYFISSEHVLGRQRAITKETVRGHSSVWIDNESKTKTEIEREVFKERPHQALRIRAFTNNEGVARQLLETGKYIVPLPNTTMVNQPSPKIRELKISKGPRVLDQEFVYNPKVSGNVLRDFVIRSLADG